jgi:hypothetical protein
MISAFEDVVDLLRVFNLKLKVPYHIVLLGNELFTLFQEGLQSLKLQLQ